MFMLTVSDINVNYFVIVEKHYPWKIKTFTYVLYYRDFDYIHAQRRF